MHLAKAALAFILALLVYGCICSGSRHEGSQLAKGSRRWPSKARRGLSSSVAYVSNGSAFILALANPAVELIRLNRPLVDVRLAAWNASGVELPITIARNVTIEGNQVDWPLLRLHYARDMVRLLDRVVLSIRYAVVDGAYGNNVNREQGFHILSPTPPHQNSAFWIGTAAVILKYCFPGNGTSSTSLLARPTLYPGEQRVIPDQPQVGCTNGPSVPPLRRCWPKRGTIFDVAGDGIRLDAAENLVPTRVVFWMFNVTGLCEILVDAGCLARQPEPLVCYMETLRQHQNSSASSLDDYMPELQQQQAEQEEWQQQRSNQASPRSLRGSAKDGVIAAGAVLAALLAAAAVIFLVRRKRCRLSCGRGGTAPTKAAAAGQGACCCVSGSCTSWSSPMRAHKCSNAGSGDTGLDTAGRDTWSARPPASADTQEPPAAESGGLRGERVLIHMDAAAPTAPAADAPVTPGTKPCVGLELRVRLREKTEVGSPGASGGSSAATCTAAGSQGDDIGNDSGGGGDMDGGGGGNVGVVELLPVVRGKGAFGRVVEGLYGGQRVAVKLFGYDEPWGAKPEALAQSLAQEVQVLSRCHHPNVVRLLAACVEAPRPCLVLELMETSLERLIHGGRAGAVAAAGGGRGRSQAPLAAKDGLIPLPKVLHIGMCIANALAYLHPTISHRDLKPANVLLNQPDSDQPIVKLTDFGLARLRLTVAPTEHPEEGTPAYMAPECYDVDNSCVTHKADIYSLGVLLWEMLTGSPPWAGHNPLSVALMVAYKRLRLPLKVLKMSRCPAKLARLIESCWDTDPERRPAAAEVAKELALVLQQVQIRSQQPPDLK